MRIRVGKTRATHSVEKSVVLLVGVVGGEDNEGGARPKEVAEERTLGPGHLQPRGVGEVPQVPGHPVKERLVVQARLVGAIVRLGKMKNENKK